ncbi:MAG: alkaline phosphatase [Erythrobacter sp.]|uniref:alkaline phosphatase n=1 Tax=Erythrobacter sp. TaxID=1042 RepID=UPI0026230F7D|nr:alkaline phosphatase [Erythrobacter sp.]MDJ0978278.1 alkaline phosphatase [Erythrobacter sp.]
MIRSFKPILVLATASLSLSACVAAINNTSYAPRAGEAPSAERVVSATAAPTRSPGKAKNVILLISDGIGFNGWLAADYYQGKAGAQSYQVVRPDGTRPVVLGMAHSSLNLVDEEGRLLPSASDVELATGAVEQGYDPRTRWERFENTFAGDFAPEAKSYTTYTDSAAAGTALMTGRKTANGRINMDWSANERFRTIAQVAMDRGRAAGAISSVMASHATPAAAIAHNVSRNNYDEIFNEMVASDLNVIMGGGHPLYDASGRPKNPEKERDYRYVGGSETLGALTSAAGLNGFAFIDAKEDFEALAAGANVPERVVGIARTGSTLQAGREDLLDVDTPSGMAFNPGVPDLPTMALGALNVLNRDEDGFFLMIEGGAIDWMGHANNMPRYIEEQVDFNATVDAVIAWVEANSSWEETLVIITSDHECGGIWGEGTFTNSAGGPIAVERTPEALTAARFNPAEDTFNGFLAVQDRGKGNMPGYQFASGNHTNELVPLWAIGIGSERFAQFTRTDTRARALWGEPYRWNGDFVDNTSVFQVMEMALRE